MGCILVFIAFILLRFFFTCPKSIWNRLNPTSQSIFFYFQQMLYWGLLIAGLILCFVSDIKIGLLTLGCFLCFYMTSLAVFSTKGIPLLHNELAGLVGIISLILGFVLSFITSLKYGFIAIGSVLLTFLIARWLMRIEIAVMKKKNLTEDYNPRESPPTL